MGIPYVFATWRWSGVWRTTKMISTRIKLDMIQHNAQYQVYVFSRPFLFGLKQPLMKKNVIIAAMQ